jgi:NADH:ubiquinone reductase (non-electrogenic)
MKEIDTNLFDVTVISPNNYFLFTPLLPSTTVGTLKTDSVIVPIRTFINENNPEIKFFESKCISINPLNKTITCLGSILYN